LEITSQVVNNERIMITTLVTHCAHKLAKKNI